MEAVSETRSRVVPGALSTMARSCSSRRLKRLLLPTLGRPTMASVRPARTSPPYWKLAASRLTPSRTGARRRRISPAVATPTSSSAKSMPASSRAISSSRLLLERRDAARNRAARLLRGDARLVERGGFDQVADGFGLGQIDAAVEKGAQGEFAGLGQARAGFEGALHGVAQHHRRAVAGDFDHVFGGVGARGLEEGDQHLVDGGLEFGHPDMPRAPRRQPEKRRMRSAMERASAPERRTMPRPPRPGGVEMATMVSWSMVFAHKLGAIRRRPPSGQFRSPRRRPRRPRPCAAAGRGAEAIARRGAFRDRGGSGRLAMPAG
jgi:hypothetical protein